MADAQPTPDPDDLDVFGMSRTVRNELQLEDSEAWKHVVGLLLAIVSVGLVLAVLTVWLSS